MEVRLENTASATTNNDPAHCFVAIELSKSSWVLGFQTPLAKQTSRYQVKACDAKAREIKRLEIVLEMISTVEAERDAILTEKKSTHLNADKIKMLAKLKAIGAEFSTTLVGEVFYREFANRRDAWRLPARGRNADDEIDSAVKEIGFHPVKPANRLRGPGSIYVVEDQSFYHPVCPVHAAAGNSESEVFAPPDPTFAP